jgi:hypothetical protein
LGSGERVVEVVIRAVSQVFEAVHRKIGRALSAQSQNTDLVKMFFSLNLIFNGVVC